MASPLRFAAPIVLAVLFGAAPAPAATNEESREKSAEPAMSLDVVDADVHEILGEIKEQCGIRNLIVDRDVAGKGTFLFREVPCSTAVPVILKSLGLRAEIYSRSVVRVSR